VQSLGTRDRDDFFFGLIGQSIVLAGLAGSVEAPPALCDVRGQQDFYRCRLRPVYGSNSGSGTGCRLVKFRRSSFATFGRLKPAQLLGITSNHVGVAFHDYKSKPKGSSRPQAGSKKK
jgi:hypothetical protein